MRITGKGRQYYDGALAALEGGDALWVRRHTQEWHPADGPEAGTACEAVERLVAIARPERHWHRPQGLEALGLATRGVLVVCGADAGLAVEVTGGGRDTECWYTLEDVRAECRRRTKVGRHRFAKAWDQHMEEVVHWAQPGRRSRRQEWEAMEHRVGEAAGAVRTWLDPVLGTFRVGVGRDGLHVVLDGGLDEQQAWRHWSQWEAAALVREALGRKAQPEREIAVVADRDLAGQKGFDKWSFRREPGTKKPRRRGR